MLIGAQVAKLTEAHISHMRCLGPESIAVDINSRIDVIKIASG